MTAQCYFEDLKVGQVLGPVEYGPITSKMLVQWAAASGDYHEIHYDKEYAQRQNLPDIVVHGPLKLALMGRLLLSLAGQQGSIKTMDCRYSALDLPGTVLQCKATVSALRPESSEADLILTVINEKQVVTAQGSGTIRLPAVGGVAPG